MLEAEYAKFQQQQGTPPPSGAPGQATPATNAARKQLDGMIFANGNFPVARRRAVVVPALEKLGYTPEQADQIALATPLNTTMYNREAVLHSLQYARAITPENIASLDTSSLPAAMAPTPVPMPPAAKTALEAGERESAPFRGVPRETNKRFNALGERVKNWWAPIDLRMSTLPQPGGVWGLFVINVVFLAFVLPANAQGRTRAELLYGTLLGSADWETPPTVPAKQTPPNSVLLESLAGAAIGIEEVATAAGQVAGAIGNVASVIANPTGAITNALTGNPALDAAAAGALTGIGAAIGGGPPLPPASAFPPRQPAYQ